MSDSPLVSIVLAVFNGERFLRDQLNSLVAQTYSNIEIIAVDDASTDASLLILQEFSQRYSNIAVSPLTVNGGQIVALEQGLQLSKGDFVAISDQDDIWVPEKIQKLIDCIQDAAAIFSDSLLVDEKGCSLNKTLMKDFVRVRPAPILHDPVALIAKNIASGHALIFKRELLPILLPFARDIMYDQQIAIVSSAVGGLRYLGDTLVLHRQHGGNTTNKLVKKNRSVQSSDRVVMRRYRKAKGFYRSLDFVTDLCLRSEIQKNFCGDRIYSWAESIKPAVGKLGFFAFCERLFFLLGNRSRLFSSVSAMKKIKKSWRFAVDGCYE